MLNNQRFSYGWILHSKMLQSCIARMRPEGDCGRAAMVIRTITIVAVHFALQNAIQSCKTRMMPVHFAKQNARQLLQAMLRKKVVQKCIFATQFAQQTAYTDRRSIGAFCVAKCTHRLKDNSGKTAMNRKLIVLHFATQNAYAMFYTNLNFKTSPFFLFHLLFKKELLKNLQNLS